MCYTKDLRVKYLIIVILFLLLRITRGELTNTRICYENCIPKNSTTWKAVCHCDQYCAVYGDCCSDSDTVLGPSSYYSCRNISGFGSSYLVTKCQIEWPNDIIRKQCEEIPDSDEDPVTKVPVTHKFSGITYANIFCGVCHGNNNLTNFEFWSSMLKCDLPKDLPSHIHNHFASESHHNNVNETFSNATFDNNTKKWGMTIGNTFIPCIIQISIPDLLTQEMSCFQITHNCSDKNSNTYEFDKKHFLTAYGLSTFSLYYSYLDEVCGSHLLSFLSCLQTRPDPTVHETDIFDSNEKCFCIIFYFSYVMENELCKESYQVYSKLYRKCITIINSTNIALEENVNCLGVYLNSHEYKLSSDNLTAYVKEYNLTLTNTEFTIVNDSHIKICVTINKFTEKMKYMTFIGLGISILFLILHLLAFVSCKDLRKKLADKALASLCLALITCYITYILMTEVINTGTRLCLAIGFIMYYALMSCFTWNLIIGFDIWNVFRRQIFTPTLKEQEAKFNLYSLFSWMVPLILTVVLCILENIPNEMLGETWKPQIQGEDFCWFHNRFALFIYLAVPCAIMMLISFVFIIWSSYLIKKAQCAAKKSAPRKSAAGNESQTFCPYIRLAMCMGLLWSLGLLAGYFDSTVLWYIYILFNTLQGFFIFLSFTCKKKVLKSLTCSKPQDAQDPHVRPVNFNMTTVRPESISTE